MFHSFLMGAYSLVICLVAGVLLVAFSLALGGVQ